MSEARGDEGIVTAVRERYGRIAEGAEKGCCGPQAAGCSAPEAAMALGIGYSEAELEGIPSDANLGLGCGAPLGFLELRPGETVLDLGSGAGIDVFLAARQVGATGRAIGVDMTPAMLERARANAQKAGVTNVEFRQGRLEALPVDDGSVDAVTSNCVINLVPDKAAVFAEVARVLKPGGRVVVADILLDGPLPAALRQDLFAYVGCISGALERADYFRRVEAAGLSEVEMLRDVDMLAAMGATLPQAVQDLLDRVGVSPAEVVGRVRSVTFRASKPAAAEACCGPTCCAPA